MGFMASQSKTSAAGGATAQGDLKYSPVVEDEAGSERKRAHEFGDGLSRLLERLEDADGKAAQAGDVFRAEAGANA